MNEKQWQQNVTDLAKMLGWIVYHPYDSRRSPEGFPDLVLAHPKRGVLFRELKTETGRLTRAQKLWLATLQQGGADADVWRPSDLDRVKRELGGIR